MTDKKDPKVAIITGASSGLGKATAEALAQAGLRIALVCRSQERAEAAMADIRKKTPDAQLSLHLADLSLMSDVRNVAQELKNTFPKIDVLVNNAGMIPGLQQLTLEGFEVGWATNHLASFLLTNLLIDNIVAADQGRIINLSSEAHKLGQIDFDNVGMPKNYSAITSYADSKLANILFTYELARRTEFTDVTVNCVHPGVVATNFGSTSNFLIRNAMRLARMFMKSPKEGAKTTVYLATSPAVRNTTGKYFKNSRSIKSSNDTYNSHIARRLWDVSEEQTGFH